MCVVPHAGRRGSSPLARGPKAGQLPPGAGAARRAKGKVRRYCRSNRLRFLWTLTYAQEAACRAACGADWAEFARSLRRNLGRLPLVAVIERGTLNGRLHLHFATDRRIPVELVRHLWHRGRIHVGDPGKLRGRVPPRRLAAYLAKYVAKSVEEAADEQLAGAAVGRHRYFLSQGFSPVCWRTRYSHVDYAVAYIELIIGCPDTAIEFDLRPDSPVFGWWFGWPDA